MNANKDKADLRSQVKAVVGTVLAVAEALRALRRVPSSTLYAHVCGLMDFAAYTRTVDTLKEAGLVRESNHILFWTGPAGSEAAS